ncbi:FecCD family ABC transporter permease [Alicyclobacillus acidiphilus]|uniref:FecCD family ABC transporter permease n=1 Tax=Alicyclobacillus acidiphilus TaxID=182455 RepID=UPI000A4E94D1|nr:iron ABC transporter permease [Alicyclobacillus acidiphilus]
MASGTWHPKNMTAIVVAGSLVALLCLGIAAVMLGSPAFTPVQMWHILTTRGDNVNHLLVWQSRIPRFTLGALAGAMLAVAGVMLQDAMRNALAGPELLGVSSGSAAVMAAIIIFGLPIPFLLQPWLALLGGTLGGAMVVVASWGDRSHTRVILIGVAVSSLLNAVITTIVSLGQQDTISLFYNYLVGGLENRTWQQVLLVLPWLFALGLSYLLSNKLNVLQLGDDVAIGLGLKAAGLRIAVFLLAIALVAPIVAACGPIGYISLLSPHIARRLLKTHDTTRVMPVAALFGAVLLTGSDILARTVFSPVEVPVGVWTTLLGGPLLLIILGKRFGRSTP